jgi:hypothetical protein
MKDVRVLLTFAVLLCAAAAHADSIDGSVFLMPINSQLEFRSVGRAEFLSTLNQRINEPLGGMHSVSGPQVYQHEVTGTDSTRTSSKARQIPVRATAPSCMPLPAISRERSPVRRRSARLPADRVAVAAISKCAITAMAGASSTNRSYSI